MSKIKQKSELGMTSYLSCQDSSNKAVSANNGGGGSSDVLPAAQLMTTDMSNKPVIV